MQKNETHWRYVIYTLTPLSNFPGKRIFSGRSRRGRVVFAVILFAQLLPGIFLRRFIFFYHSYVPRRLLNTDKLLKILTSVP